MSEIKIVVFDCDGVLFDSREANRRYYNHLLGRFGHPPMDEAELEYVHTHSADLATRHIFRKWPGELEAADAFRGKVDYTPFLPYMKMEEGLVDFLERVRKKANTAISTNRTTTMEAVMEMSGLGPYFDLVVTARDVRNPKPHPEALVRILEHFGLRAEEGVFIGDSEVDRRHAASVGMPFIAYRNPDLQADFHAASFGELGRLPVFERGGV